MITAGPLVIAAPWGLLALAGVPAVLAIHWFRRRSPPRPVTALFLWPPPAPSATGGRRRERIIGVPSLWLELLAMLALAWWLADIHGAGDGHGRHLVVVLDDRSRLQARLPAGDTPAGRLRAALDARLAGLRANDRVTVIASGASPRLLAGPGADPAAVRMVIAHWQPMAPWHELDAALALAAQLARADAGGSLLLASDREPPQGTAPGIVLMARGEPLPTSGLADARWLRDGRGERLVLRVVGTAPPRPLEVRTTGGAAIARVPAASGTVVIPLAAMPPDELAVALIGDDPLPADDAAALRRPPLRALRVAVTLPEPQRSSVLRVLAALPAIDPPGAAPDLVIAAVGDPVPGAWGLRLAPGGGEGALGPFLIRRGHPLCRDLDGGGLLWVGGLPAGRLPADATALISAGEQVLLAERRRGRDRLIDAYADPGRGTLLSHPLWPSLLANLVEARRAALPGCAQATIATGLAVPVVLPPRVQGAVLRGPDGAEAALAADADGAVLLPALDRPGRWRIDIAGAQWLELDALALDPRQGDLADALTTDRGAPAIAEAVIGRRRSPAALLLPLILAAGAALGAWWFGGKGR